MSQENGKETPEKKGNDSQETVESLKAKLQKSEDEKATLLKETMSRKEKLEALEKEKNKEKENALAEQGKYKELYDSVMPKIQRFDALVPRLEKIYETEIQDIPEDKRDLIPQGNVEEKLEWVRNAKSKGIFGAQKQAPANSLQSKTNGHMPGTPEFVSWQSNDPRLTKLSTAEFVLWKQHNRRNSSGVKGWA